MTSENPDPIDYAKANFLGELGSDLLNVMLEAARKSPTPVEWTDLIMAAAIAMRGVAADAVANNRNVAGLNAQDIKTLVVHHFAKVMMLPDSGWKVAPVAGDTKASYIACGPKH
jgi:hypothetical protein